jgi:hypothetical protein
VRQCETGGTERLEPLLQMEPKMGIELTTYALGDVEGREPKRRETFSHSPALYKHGVNRQGYSKISSSNPVALSTFRRNFAFTCSLFPTIQSAIETTS